MVTIFGCPKILLSDEDTHFVNKVIAKLTVEFQIHHRKTTPYHPQVNGMVEALNKILENALTKVCNVHQDDWDHKVSAVLLAYHMNYKRIVGHTQFRLVYGQEVVVPMEYIVLSIRIVALMEMIEGYAIEQRLSQLVQME